MVSGSNVVIRLQWTGEIPDSTNAVLASNVLRQR
jgi:hypothetical protein